MKVLLVDTAFAAAPIYEYLVACGHDTWVMGNRPADLLARMAGDRWIEEDYSDVGAVQSHVDRLGIDRVIPGCTDVSMETCLQLTLDDALRDSPETNQRLAAKDLFREMCARLELSAPRVVEERTLPQPGTFICKPVDAFSGRGITVFDGEDVEGLKLATEMARAASRSGKVLIEHFVSGQLHSCSGFVENSRFEEFFFVREGSSANPYAVDTSFLVTDLPRYCIEKVVSDIRSVVEYLKLKDGLLHIQFLMSHGRPYIVEMARRCPGDLYPLLIEYGTGYRYAARYASFFLGEPLSTRAHDRRLVLRHTVAAADETWFAGLVCPFGSTMRAFFPLAVVGERLLPQQGTRVGILFCEYPDIATIERAYQGFLARQTYQLDRSTA